MVGAGQLCDSGNSASRRRNGAQSKQDDATTVGIPGGLHERVDKGVAFPSSWRREDLLELVDRDDQALTRPQVGDRRGEPSGYAPGELRGRQCAGPQQMCPQCSLPGSAPAASAGNSPARSNDDFPLPEGPTTARSAESARRPDELADQTLAAEEELASAVSNGASP